MLKRPLTHKIAPVYVVITSQLMTKFHNNYEPV